MIELPTPQLTPGMSLSGALRLRQTIRGIQPEMLPIQLLSNVLWAACGVNRSNGPFGTIGVTAASASNSREVEVYVALASGVWRFDPVDHVLVEVASQDLRGHSLSAGQRQRLPSVAPVELLYVADFRRLTHTTGFQEPGLHDPEVQNAYAHVDTGMIAANVYLFAAAYGLAAWFHNCDRLALGHELRLRNEQRVLFAQSIGYPAE